MAGRDLVELESFINNLPGVLGCVILTDPAGEAAEIQAFTGSDVDRNAIQAAISGRVESLGAGAALKQVHVFELEAEGELGGRAALERMVAEMESGAVEQTPEPQVGERRPRLARVDLSSPEEPIALVSLQEGGQEVTGRARGELGSGQLRVIAEATLQAVGRLIEGPGFTPVEVGEVRVFGRDAVVALVAEEGGPEMLGAVLVRGGSTSEAAVRATLDAVNRRLQRKS